MRNLKPTRLGKTSRKKTLRSLAQAGLFPHLAGFQYLRDVHLPRFSSKKTVSKILDGTISQEMIEKGGQYEESVKPRLLALVSLEAMLDNNFTFYSFMPRFYSFFTSIKADYLIAMASSLLRKLNHSLMKPEAKSETLPSLPHTMVGRDFSISLNFRADFIHNISTKVWSTSAVADLFCGIRNFIRYALFGEEAFIQKKVLDSNVLNAVFVPPRLDVVFYNHDFLKGIRDTKQ